MDSDISLRDYQIADLSFLMQHERCALLHDPGGGKTPPVCVYFYWLWSTQKKRSLWVMPKQLFKKNKVELLRFTHFNPDDVFILDGKPQTITGDPKVIILGPDRLRLCWRELISRFPDIDCVVGDETHMYWSTDGSARTQSMYMLMQKAKRFVAMTGSIIKGRLSSAYPVIHVIEPRYYASYAAFDDFHTLKDIYGKPIAPCNGDRLAAIFGKHAIKRSFESIYGPEAKVIVTELCPMSPKHREAYKEFEKEAILELESTVLEAPGGGVFALRCAQIMATPHIFGLCEGETTGKDAQLDIHIADHQASGDPCVVFARFVEEQERIAKRIRDANMTVAVMNGNTSTKQRALIDENFRSGKLQWIVGSAQVAAIGFNWGHCHHVIFTSLTYGDDDFYQAYRRFIRGKRYTPLLITVLEYEDSIDQRIMLIIQRKSSLAKTVDDTREVFDLSVA